MSKRALRRHHYRRIKQRWERILGWWGWNEECAPTSRGYDKAGMACVRATTHTLCSCPMCGNPRRHSPYGDSKLTIQERRAFQDEGDLVFNLKPESSRRVVAKITKVSKARLRFIEEATMLDT